MDLTGLFHALTGSGQPQGLLGTGMAQQAAQVIQSRPYQLHVQEARAMGQQPMTPEQFAQAMAPQTRPNLGF